MLKIRRAAIGDEVLLAELEQASFSDPWSEKSLQAYLSEPHGLVLLARLEEKICGYLVSSLLLEEGELLRIATLPSFRKKGVGRALLTAFKKEAEKGGAKTLFLEVRKGNSAARCLYESEGFLLLGERKNYYRDPTEDALLYQYTIKCEEMQ